MFLALRSSQFSHCNDSACCRQHEWVDRCAEHLIYENAAQVGVRIMRRVIEIDDPCRRGRSVSGMNDVAVHAATEMVKDKF